MSTSEEAQKALEALNGNSVDGRALTVNVASPREERSGGGGGGQRRPFSGCARSLLRFDFNHVRGPAKTGPRFF